MALVSCSLCLTVAICAISAHIAIPTALILAVSCIVGAVFLGSVTAVVLVGVGFVAAILFGFGTILWTIITSILAPYPVDKAADKEGDCLDRTAELSSYFSSSQDDDAEAGADRPTDAYDYLEPVDTEDCATHLHSSASSTCPSFTCSFTDPDEKRLLDFLSSYAPSTRPSAGGFLGHSPLSSPLRSTSATASATCTPAAAAIAIAVSSPRASQRAADDVGQLLAADDDYWRPSPGAAQVGSSRNSPPAHTHTHTPGRRAASAGGSPATNTDLVADLTLPEFEGDELDVDVMANCQLIALLGKGKFGVVDLVRLTMPDGTSQLAVRKTLPHRDVHSYMFLRAMQSVASSPFTVHYLGSCGYLADRLEIFTDYVDGGSLEQELDAALRANPTDARVGRRDLILPLERIRVITASVLLALSELHAQGLAHLALEAPRHVLVTSSGRVQLGGMSSAARLGSRNHFGRLLGAACCTAPELMRRTRSGKAPRIVAESDVYSVGVLAGMCAFGYGQQWEAGNVAGESRWGEVGVAGGAVPEWVSEDLRAFIEEVMAEDPRQRPSLEQALGHPFLQGLEEDDVLL
ncbi:hypothetical protein VOLCADRAFT_89011 [Volvox carteri f. nagariensis]|uniref:Protein kinase domain-containing protein n=1 Tax=Volvox carteri f. nagariensis TaxID=3068 RepID=D8TQJ8_VOLCA|nr:uncharacterized protein VOLCADRAFT_89011 [Volvox carteri f. nagariensis]EFJ50166.1 hypothetical protein VOLCADRAFT_89011 [Volvox carteri f. nagariensis]|eukprot:XP_002948786.1 hypothetical protein VOLCADRAFT_89011 [Volvox carteri f. nagariensis]